MRATLLLLLGGWWAQAQPKLAGCPVFPADNIWNTPIDTMPLHPRSAIYIRSIGADRKLHPDFGPSTGIPINIVPEDQPLVNFRIEQPAESDPGPYPIPPNPLLESGTDAHALVLRRGDCKLFELIGFKQDSGGIQVYCSATFDLRSNRLRPDGWTSSDAAGLPVLPGLVRWEEIEAGEIAHALRFTAPRTKREYVWPARHFASRSDDPELPPLGLRFRLKKDFDISRFPPKVQVLMRALKKYGMILADNGQPWFITGSQSPNWTAEFIAAVKNVPVTALEVVDVSELQVGPNSARAKLPPNLAEAMGQGAKVTFDIGQATVFRVMLGEAETALTFENLDPGKTVSVVACQDAAGNRVLKWPSNVRGGMTVGRAAGKCSAQSFVVAGGELVATSPGAKDF
jgi:hypothetical protein